jgi:hypothetical protein
LINRDMAYYAAMRLNDMLREGSASSLAEAEGYLAGVSSILRSVYGDDYGNGGALEPRRSLTEAERTYLSDFFDTAALAELGRIGWEGDGRSEGETDARRETEERVLRTAADGLVTILNPAADGDPGAVYSGILHDDLERLERALAAAEPDEADAAEFRSLAHLMTHTSVTPHQDLARFAAETAITVERASAATATGTSGGAVGHGTRDLLDFALRRPDVAPEVLAFESRDSSESNATRFLEGFYAQPADGDPSARSRPVDPVVSEFLATATRLPEGVDPSSPEGRAQAEGALAFLNAVRHGGEHLMWDHAAVVRDVATTWTDADPERFGSFTRLRTFENPWRDD